MTVTESAFRLRQNRLLELSEELVSFTMLDILATIQCSSHDSNSRVFTLLSLLLDAERNPKSPGWMPADSYLPVRNANEMADSRHPTHEMSQSMAAVVQAIQRRSLSGDYALPLNVLVAPTVLFSTC